MLKRIMLKEVFTSRTLVRLSGDEATDGRQNFCKSPAKRGLTAGSWCGTIDTKAGTVPACQLHNRKEKIRMRIMTLKKFLEEKIDLRNRLRTGYIDRVYLETTRDGRFHSC